MSDDARTERVGRALVARGILSESQLRTVREYQGSIGGDLETIVHKLGFCEEDRLREILDETPGAHDEPVDSDASLPAGEGLPALIDDPVVQALALALIRSGSLDPEEWHEQLARLQRWAN